MAMTAWQCSRPAEAMLAVYASDPALAAMRLDFTDLVRRTTAVTASGLPARRGDQAGAASWPQTARRLDGRTARPGRTGSTGLSGAVPRKPRAGRRRGRRRARRPPLPAGPRTAVRRSGGRPFRTRGRDGEERDAGTPPDPGAVAEVSVMTLRNGSDRRRAALSTLRVPGCRRVVRRDP
ncbi:hypothetical protein ACH4F6_15795 [Streptomyces sp. NPDC017936]|uniref:hypothetical protein n=1 Tax=Streptomyces sp. NPDC017936 TaxID=3365016 RepID=UPI003794DA21